MPIFENAAKRKAERGEMALGMAVRQSRTADHALLAKTCGFDWIFIDLEHSSLSIEQASNMCSTALAAGIAPFVRVASHAHHHSTRLLDTGALGVIVPDVDTPEQAAAIVKSCRFPPVGKRSISSAVPQLAFEPVPIAEMMSTVDREIMVVAMLESPVAIRNADAIAAVEGLDAIIIGGNDLTVRYGVPGDFNAPVIQDAFAAMLKAAEHHGKIAGFAGVSDEETQVSYIQQGACFVLCGTDIAFLQSAASSKVKALWKGVGKRGC